MNIISNMTTDNIIKGIDTIKKNKSIHESAYKYYDFDNIKRDKILKYIEKDKSLLSMALKELQLRRINKTLELKRINKTLEGFGMNTYTLKKIANTVSNMIELQLDDTEIMENFLDKFNVSIVLDMSEVVDIINSGFTVLYTELKDGQGILVNIQ